jgi:hypothetical protein
MQIDTDMKFPPYGITRLIERDKDIIGGFYVRKTSDHRPLIFEFNEDTNFEEIFEFPRDKPFQVDGVATGFLLVKKSVFQKFASENIAPFDCVPALSGRPLGEDLSFCKKARQLGFEIWCDPTIPLGHIGTEVFTIDHFDEKRKYHEWLDENETYNNNIPGWMTRTELNWLHKTAMKMDSIVEIGSWKGKSTHALLSGCKGTVHAVDHFQGSRGEELIHQEAIFRDIYKDFKRNVGHFKNLKVHKMSSLEASKKFKDKSVDMVFIDGSHLCDEVKDDINAWLPKAKKLICGHDFQWDNVQEAVTEVLGITDVADTIWVKWLQ